MADELTAIHEINVIINRPRDSNALGGERTREYKYLYTHIETTICSLPLRVSLVSSARQQRPAKKTKRCWLASSASACLLARVSARVKAKPASPSNHPSSIHPAHAPDTHIAIAISLPFPIHPHPSAIAASLRRHLRLCVPSRAYQSNPKHACRDKGWRCICDHRASTALLSPTSIHIAPLAINPGSPHHRLTTAITTRDPSIDPQMAP